MDRQCRGAKMLSMVGVNIKNKTLQPEHVDNISKNVIGDNEECASPEFGAQRPLNDDLLLELADATVQKLMASCENVYTLPTNSSEHHPLQGIEDQTCNPNLSIQFMPIQEESHLEHKEDIEEQQNIDDPTDKIFNPDEDELIYSDSEDEVPEHETAVNVLNAVENRMQESENISEGRSRQKRRHVNQAEWKKNIRKTKKTIRTTVFRKAKTRRKMGLQCS